MLIRLILALCCCVFLVNGAQAQSASAGEPEMEFADTFWVATLPGDSPNSRHDDAITACRASFDSYSTINQGKTANVFFPSIGSEGVMGFMSCDYEGPDPGTTTDGKSQLACPDGFQKHDGGRACVRFKPNEGDECAGNPINVLSGNKVQVEQDFSVGRGRLHFTRSYMSDAGIGFAGPMAVSWTSNFHNTAHGAYNGSRGFFTYRTENGGTIRFLKSPANGWARAGLNPRDNDDPVFYGARREDLQGYRLEEAAGEEDYTLYLTTPDNVVRTYAFFPLSRGRDARLNRLESITYPDGYEITLNYGDNALVQTAIDSDGYGIAFYYDDRNLLERVVAPDGTEYRYEYDRLWVYVVSYEAPNTNHSQYVHVLSKVSYPDDTPGDATDNPERLYHYAQVTNRIPKPISPTTNYLTGITDERGVRISSWEYAHTEAGYRAVASYGANGREETRIDEITPLEEYKVTNALGKEAIYSYRKENNIYRLTALDGQASANCQASNTTTDYTDEGFPETVTGEEGQLSTTTYVAGTDLPETMTYGVATPEETQISLTWNTTIRKPTRIVRSGLQTDIQYNGQQHIKSIQLTDTTTHTKPYKTQGQKRKTTYAWFANGLLKNINGPLSGTQDRVSFTYDGLGNLKTVTDGNGLTTTINSVDGMGRPTRMTEASGLITDFTYTPRGWLKTITQNPGNAQRRTTLAYDAAGNLTRLTPPNGGWTDYTYDASGWVTKAKHRQGDTLTYTYDNLGNVKRIQARRSNNKLVAQSTATYDELGRLIGLLGGASDSRSFGYDRSDRLTEITNGLGRSWLTSFDALDRVISTTDPENHTTRQAYDSDGDLRQFRDARNFNTNFVHNGFGQIIQEVSPDRGKTRYWYDVGGRLTRRVDATGKDARFVYDGMGRITAFTYPKQTELNRTFTYDLNANAQGRLSRVQSGVGDRAPTQSLTYNHYGEVTLDRFELEGQRYDTRHTYNAAGVQTMLTYPSGRQVQISSDRMQRPTRLRTRIPGNGWTNVAASISYHPYGPVNALTYPSGQRAIYTVDRSYRLREIQLKDGSAFAKRKRLTYNAANLVTSINDLAAPETNASYTYTDDERLASTSGVWNDLSWTYDAVGNRRKQIDATLGETDTYAYYNKKNRLRRVTRSGTGDVRNLTYTASGDVKNDTREDGSLYSYTYDQAGRLEYLADEDLTNPQIVGTYHYDYRDLRVRRQLANGMVSHFVFLADGRLLGEYDGSTGAVIQEYIWLGDRLVGQVDGAGTLRSVLTGHLGQPLRIMSTTADVLWDGEMDPFGQYHAQWGSEVEPIQRLPGQWYERGSGLVQNWHRSYDPTLGRYLQADPIGLAGGQSVYGYAYQNPMSFIDPDGLRAGGWGGAGLAIGGAAYALANALCDALADDPNARLGQILRRAGGQVAMDYATDPLNWLPGIGPLRNFGGPLGRALSGGGKGTPPRPRGGGNGNGSGAGGNGGPDRGGPARGHGWNDFWKNDSGSLGKFSHVKKAVNSKLPHAVEQGVNRGIFNDAAEAGNSLRRLSQQISKDGRFPTGSIVDTRPNRVLVPVGNNGYAVYRVESNGTASLRTVLNAR